MTFVDVGSFESRTSKLLHFTWTGLSRTERPANRRKVPCRRFSLPALNFTSFVFSCHPTLNLFFCDGGFWLVGPEALKSFIYLPCKSNRHQIARLCFCLTQAVLISRQSRYPSLSCNAAVSVNLCLADQITSSQPFAPFPVTS